MDEILAEIFRLDDAGDHPAIVAFLIAQSRDPGLFVNCLHGLLKDFRFAAAAHLGTALITAGFDHPIPHLGRAIGAVMADDPGALADSAAALARLSEALPPESRDWFRTHALDPAVFGVVADALGRDDHRVLHGALDILKAGTPLFRTLFDAGAEVPGPAEMLRRQRGDPARLIAWRSPPAAAPRRPRPTVVALRHRYFPHRPQSRVMDIGPRIVEAVRGHGWPARLCPMSLSRLAEDFDDILAACRDAAAEMLIMDDHFIHLVQLDTTWRLRRDLIAALRRDCPGIRIVALQIDAWEIDPALLRRSVADIDLLWTINPALPVWRDPLFAGKVLACPLPHGGHVRPPDDTPPRRIGFIGGLQSYNWHRALWRGLALTHGLPIDWHLSSHGGDGLEPLDSHAAYLARLAACRASLNLSMRPTLARIATDRTIEVPLTGGLLVQEDAEDLDHYLVAGEHYLRFGSFAELRGLVRLIETEPEIVQAIRHAGHRFVAARYADDKLIGYLDFRLFHAGLADPVA